MPTAYRHFYQGKPLRNSIYTTDADDAPPPDWKDDFAVAFGIPAEQIECEVIPWDGDPAHLPTEEEADALERLPEDKRAGYVPPPPREPTLEEKVAAMLAAMSATQQADVSAALKG